jgi:hypothetical protein
MLEFCIGSYLILAILGALFWWGAFRVARHTDDLDQRLVFRKRLPSPREVSSGSAPRLRSPVARQT